jgi:hypothetical protein
MVSGGFCGERKGEERSCVLFKERRPGAPCTASGRGGKEGGRPGLVEMGGGEVHRRHGATPWRDARVGGAVTRGDALAAESSAKCSTY